MLTHLRSFAWQDKCVADHSLRVHDWLTPNRADIAFAQASSCSRVGVPAILRFSALAFLDWRRRTILPAFGGGGACLGTMGRVPQHDGMLTGISVCWLQQSLCTERWALH